MTGSATIVLPDDAPEDTTGWTFPAPVPPIASEPPDAPRSIADLSDDERAERLALVLQLHIGGATADEIASRFAVTSRTVRRWIADAKRRAVAEMRARSPESWVLDWSERNSVLASTLMKSFKQAAEREDARAMAELARQVRHCDRDRLAILDKLGAFNGMTLFDRNAEDPAANAARVLQQLAADFLKGRFADGTEAVPALVIESDPAEDAERDSGLD